MAGPRGHGHAPGRDRTDRRCSPSPASGSRSASTAIADHQRRATAAGRPTPLGKTVDGRAPRRLAGQLSATSPWTLAAPLSPACLVRVPACCPVRLRPASPSRPARLASLRHHRDGGPQRCSSFLLPSSLEPNASLHGVGRLVEPPDALGIMLGATAVFLPVILAYTAWVYRVLRGHVTPAELGNNPNAPTERRRTTMWYFSWILGIGFACASRSSTRCGSSCMRTSRPRSSTNRGNPDETGGRSARQRTMRACRMARISSSLSKGFSITAAAPAALAASRIPAACLPRQLRCRAGRRGAGAGGAAAPGRRSPACRNRPPGSRCRAGPAPPGPRGPTYEDGHGTTRTRAERRATGERRRRRPRHGLSGARPGDGRRHKSLRDAGASR